MIRLFSFLLFVMFSFSVFGQKGCSSAQFLREKNITSKAAGNESWYRFRAKGNLLLFTGRLEGDSTLEYEIYKDAKCEHVSAGYHDPIRSTVEGFDAMTDEMWSMVIDEGRCVCKTCLSKIKFDHSKPLKVKQGEMYLLRVVSHGKPFQFNMDYKEVDKLNPIQFDVADVNVDQLEVGMVYQLREIFFIPATPKYLPKSLPELEKLKKFLDKNTVLNVEIRGHVNGPLNNKPKFYQELSDARAQAVKDFLIKNGVEENRINTKGMANLEMRYASPKNEFEANENRRVEMVITTIK